MREVSSRSASAPPAEVRRIRPRASSTGGAATRRRLRFSISMERSCAGQYSCAHIPSARGGDRSAFTSVLLALIIRRASAMLALVISM